MDVDTTFTYIHAVVFIYLMCINHTDHPFCLAAHIVNRADPGQESVSSQAGRIPGVLLYYMSSLPALVKCVEYTGAANRYRLLYSGTTSTGRVRQGRAVPEDGHGVHGLSARAPQVGAPAAVGAGGHQEGTWDAVSILL